VDRIAEQTERKYIYNANGNKIYLGQPETREIAVVRLQDTYSNYPTSGLTAATLAAILKEADQGDIYRQMELFEEIEEKDTRIFSSLQTRKQAVIGLKWDILPGDEKDAGSVKRAEFTREVVGNIKGFSQSLFDLLDATGKACAMSEISWNIQNGSNIITDLIWRHQKRFTLNETQTEFCLLTDSEPTRGESLEDYPAKFIIHKYKARSGYPGRAGLLRTLCWFYLFKSYNIKDWIRFCEVYGIPLRLGRYDSSATPNDRTALRAAVQAIGSDGAGIISKSTEIEFITALSGAANSEVFKTFIDFINTEITIVILGQTATTEGTPGALGAESARDKVRQDLLEADCIGLMETASQQIIVPLEVFNFGVQDKYSRFKLFYEPPEDLNKRVELDKVLVETGLPLAESYFYKTYDRPVPEKGERIVTPAARSMGPQMPPMPPMSMGHNPERPSVLTMSGSGQTFSPRQQGCEDIGDTVLREYEKIYPNIEKKLNRIVMNSESLKQIRDRIYLAFDEIASDDQEKLIARAMILAGLYGLSTVKK